MKMSCQSSISDH